MLLLGIDIGTSSVKVSVVDSQSRRSLASASYPDSEAPILSKQPGWAEQSPESWWQFTCEAVRRAHQTGAYHPADIGAIGIAYQMHGLVVVDQQGAALRDSIIWCDSRAVPFGHRAAEIIGEQVCRDTLLNTPGNFTAAKLAWVKAHEPELYKKIHRMLLPGDFIALRLTGETGTTVSALSEAMLWNFREHQVAQPVLDALELDASLIPVVRDVFAEHGRVAAGAATALGIRTGIPVTYKAGDQPNNALSLNVLRPGEVAANAGTSGVVYAVSDRLQTDPEGRVNCFAHVNHTAGKNRIGVLLCINGAGITSNWIRAVKDSTVPYPELNAQANAIPPGAEGLVVLPFGNGAERMLGNRLLGAQVCNLDYNRHGYAHLYRAGIEGVAAAFRYGMEGVRQTGIRPAVIRAGHANMFLSSTFCTTLVNMLGIPVELYHSDGSYGAALGAGIGAGMYSTENAFSGMQPVAVMEPEATDMYNSLYERWHQQLQLFLQHT